MTGPRWQRIKDLFAAAAALDAPERDALLERECGGDAALRAEVESLLRAHQAEAAPALAEEPGTRVGPYKLLEQIGEGGFGVVFLAEQETPVRRRVALKIVKPGMDTRQVVARFEQERQALALMDHPNIAKVFDAGATASGRPFFVMELVKGDPITSYCDREKLTTQERLALLAEVCRAVQHAHHKGVIHRDLKPNNVLVTIIDGKPVPKVIDFGVAKATQGRLTDRTLFTEHRQMIGTPLYMSPEQAQLSGVDVDTRSDVYSLGVLLYELLTGTPPFDQQQLLQAGIAEIHRMIRELEPPRPSTRVATLGTSSTSIAAQRRVEARQLGLLLRGDVDWIVMKCLEKERARRYDTASALAQDIDRHLAGEAVDAAPPSAVYRLRKFVRRKKGLVAASAAVALVAFVGVGATLWQAEAARQADRRRASEAIASAETQRGLTARAERAREDAELEAYIANIAAADAALNANDIATVRRRLDACPERLRNWEWRYLDAESDGSVRVLWDIVPGTGLVSPYYQGATFSIDGTRFSTAHRSTSDRQVVRILDSASSGEGMALPLDDGDNAEAHVLLADRLCVASWSRSEGARAWDAVPGAKTRIVPLPGFDDTNYFAAHFSVDGSSLATVTWRIAKIWSTTTWQVKAELPLDSGLNSLELSDDAARFVMAERGRHPRIGLISDNRRIHVLRGHTLDVYSCRFAPNGLRVATASEDWTARIWDTDTALSLAELRGHEGPVRSVSFSPDGERLVTASSDRTARIWNASTGQWLVTLRGHSDALNMACFSPDGAHVATASADATARLWDAKTGQELIVLRGHLGPIHQVAFTHSGAQLVTGSSEDSTVRQWDLETQLSMARIRAPASASQGSGCFFDADGSWVTNGERVHELDSGRHMASLDLGMGGEDTILAVHPAHDRMLTQSSDGTVRLQDVVTGETVLPLPAISERIRCAEFSSDGSRILTGGRDAWTVWNCETGAVCMTLGGPQRQVTMATFDRTGERIATASEDGSVMVQDSTSGRTIRVVSLGSPVLDVGFSPDGTRIFAACRSGCLILDLTTGQVLTELADSELDSRKTFTPQLAWSPDGSRLVRAVSARISRRDVEQRLRLWNAKTGERIADLSGHGAFSPDGSRIVTCAPGGLVRVWEAGTGKELLRLQGPTGASNASFSPDGSRIASHDRSRLELRIWDSVSHRLRASSAHAMHSAIEAMRSKIVSMLHDKTPEQIQSILMRDGSLSAQQRRGAAVVLTEMTQTDPAIRHACEKAIADLQSASVPDSTVAAALSILASAAKREPTNPGYRTGHGMALYRSGRFAEALSELRSVSPFYDDWLASFGWNASSWSQRTFLAMTHCKLSHQAEAEGVLATLKEGHVSEFLMDQEPIAALLAEAEAVFAAAFPRRQ